MTAKKHPPVDAAQTIRMLAADGWSMRGLASHLGTTQDTVRRWFDEQPELREAFDQGREAERHTLHNRLYRIATEDGIEPRDAAIASMFLLKARHGYREGDQGEQVNRVAITFNLPGAMPLEKFVEVEGNNDGTGDGAGAERLPAKASRATRRG